MTLDRLLVVGRGRQGTRHVDVATRWHIARRLVTVDPVARVDPPSASVEHFFDLEQALGLDYDAAVVATPTHTHCEIVDVLLRRGIPTLVEKPFAGNAAEAESLVELAATSGTSLFVGYVERFNPVVQLLVALVRSEIAGAPISYMMRRFGMRPHAPLDIDVIHDLSVHDIDLALHLTSHPILVGAAGHIGELTGQIDAAQLVLQAGNTIVGIETSGVAPRRERTTSICTDGAMLVADLIEQHVDVLVDPNRTIDVSELAAFGTVSAHASITTRVQARQGEPLANELQAFVASLGGEPDPRLATPQDALAVATIAEHASSTIMASALHDGTPSTS